MDLIKHASSVPTKPAPITSGTAGWATHASGTTGTVVTADAINGILAELKNLIEGAGLTLNINDDTLVRQAVQLLGGLPGITYNAAGAGTITVTAGNFVAPASNIGQLHADNIYIDPPTGNPFLVVGRTDNAVSVTTPFIDFRPKNQASFTDVRLLASGGTTGVDFQGSLQILADTVTKWTDGVVTTFDNFPAGTKIVFYQNAAPPGWTNIGWGANFTLVSGVGGTFGGGGGAGHNIITGCNVVASHFHQIDPATVLTGTENQAHNHNVQDAFYAESGAVGTGPWVSIPTGAGSNSTDQDNDTARYRTVVSGTENQAHNHYVDIPLTNTGANIGNDIWQPTWVSVICCSKNA